MRRAALDSLVKLSPQHLYNNPVMFVVEIGSVLTTVLWLRDIVAAAVASAAPLWFTGSVTLWLWFTVLFANFAEAIAEGRGKAQADTLRKMRTETIAHRLDDGRDHAKCPPRPCAREITWSSKPASTFPATAK